MLRYVTFFAKTLFLSLSSTAQGYIHLLYEKLLPPKEKAPSEPINILIVQLGQLGDFVLSIPFFGALKAAYGNRLRLVIITDQINEDLVKKNSQVNEVIIYNSKKYSRVKQKEDTMFPLLSLKDKTFDKSIWLRGDSKIFYWLIVNRIPMVSIAKYPNPLRWSWLSLIIKRPIKIKFKHYVEYLDDLDKNIKPSLIAFNLNKIFNAQLGRDSQKDIFLHIGAGSDLRKWPEENFSRLLEKLLAYDTKIVINLLGSKLDWEVAERIRSKISLSKYLDRVKNICGEVSLPELSEILSNGKLYIGFDSGPMHIAALSGISIVAMMGPQSPQLFRPWGKQEIRVVYKNYFCSPCWQFSCLHVRSGPGACVLAIQPQEVFEEAKSILDKKGCNEY